VADPGFVDEGVMLSVARSKTDQEGRRQVVAPGTLTPSLCEPS